MPAVQWATPPQRDFLQSKLSSYMAATDQTNQKSLARFWVTLNESWFKLFPAETSHAPLEDHALQLASVGLVIQKTKDVTLEELDALPCRPAQTSGWCWLYQWCRGGWRGRWGRWGRTRSLFQRLLRGKETHPLRKVEIYQKMHRLKISAELRRRGFGDLNEEAEVARAASAEGSVAARGVELTEEETQAAEIREAQEIKEWVRKNRQARMSLQVRTATEMYLAESDEVKTEVAAEMEALNKERAAGAGDGDGQFTPEGYQHAIDQLRNIAETVLRTIAEETGWHLCLLAGGPMPNRGGAISTKTISFGTTPHGSDFQASHPNFEEGVKTHFNKFLKRAFPHEIRDARALVTVNNNEDGPDLNGLLSMDDASAPDPPLPMEDDENDDEGAPTAPPVMPTLSVPRPPKRIRHKRVKQPLPVPTLTPITRMTIVPVPPGFDDNMRDIISPTFNAFPDFVDDLFPAPVQSQYGPAFDAITQEPAVLHPPTFDAAGEDLPPSAVTPRAQPRPIFHGAVFAPECAIGTSPGGGRNRSIYAPSGLFRVFSSGPSAHSPVTSTSLTSASVASSATTITDVGGLFRSTPLFPSTLAWFNATLAKNSGASQATVAPEPSTSPTASLGMPPPPTSVTFAASVHATSSPLPLVFFVRRGFALDNCFYAHEFLGLVAACFLANGARRCWTCLVGTDPPAKRGRPCKDASTVSADVVEPTPAPAPAPRPRGRLRKSATLALDSIDASSSASASANTNDRNVVPPMTEAARVESDRIHREEVRMREERAELCWREKEMEAKEAALEAERQRLRNPAGGADLVVVSRPKRAVKATQNPDGSPVIRPVTKKRAEVAGSRLAITVVDPNTRQANEDAALLKRLNGKRKAADPPATKPRAAKKARK
ncbi:hypothetical protein B0H14DRAFT_3425774 [Mycena olivaceomarginata]|nr:hypothetical protein B0H14DRAFT_3425774 [Mycena olivaceomarginata]